MVGQKDKCPTSSRTQQTRYCPMGFREEEMQDNRRVRPYGFQCYARGKRKMRQIFHISIQTSETVPSIYIRNNTSSNRINWVRLKDTT